MLTITINDHYSLKESQGPVAACSIFILGGISVVLGDLLPLPSELDMHCHLQFLTYPRDILQVGITQSLSATPTPRCTGKTLIIPTSEAVWLPGKVARADASLQIKGENPS